MLDGGDDEKNKDTDNKPISNLMFSPDFGASSTPKKENALIPAIVFLPGVGASSTPKKTSPKKPARPRFPRGGSSQQPIIIDIDDDDDEYEDVDEVSDILVDGPGPKFSKLSISTVGWSAQEPICLDSE